MFFPSIYVNKCQNGLGNSVKTPKCVMQNLIHSGGQAVNNYNVLPDIYHMSCL